MLHAIYVNDKQHCSFRGPNCVPPLLSIHDAIPAEECVRIIENQRSSFERDATVLPLVDPVLLAIPFKSHRYTNCITLKFRGFGDRGYEVRQRANRQVLVNQRPMDTVTGRRKLRSASFQRGSAGKPLGTPFPRDRHGPAFHNQDERAGCGLDCICQNRFRLVYVLAANAAGRVILRPHLTGWALRGRSFHGCVVSDASSQVERLSSGSALSSNSRNHNQQTLARWPREGDRVWGSLPTTAQDVILPHSLAQHHSAGLAANSASILPATCLPRSPVSPVGPTQEGQPASHGQAAISSAVCDSRRGARR